MTLTELLPKYSAILDEYYRIVFRPKLTKEEIDQYIKDRNEVMKRLDRLYNPSPIRVDGNIVTSPAPQPIIQHMCKIYDQLKDDDKETRDAIRQALGGA